MTTHLRPTQLAAYLDLAPQKISQLRARGIITPEADGSYEAEATRIAYIRHLRANVVPAASATLTEERAKLLRARRERMELETARMAGLAISVEEVNHLFAAVKIAWSASRPAVPTASPRRRGVRTA